MQPIKGISAAILLAGFGLAVAAPSQAGSLSGNVSATNNYEADFETIFII